jgi:3'5'-cyclic nucleotide phosphodiesterase
MHCSEAFFVLKRPDHNILESLSAPARAEIRSTIIHQVLATDMQQHFKNLAELKAEVDKKKSVQRTTCAAVHGRECEVRLMLLFS